MAVPAFDRTEVVDRQVAAAAKRFLQGCIPTPFALLAVGGYGRRELFPFSDVDLILLLPGEPDSAAIKEPLGELLSALWDSSIKASHSVRSVNECCRVHEGNPHLSISLLDVRCVYGDNDLFRSLTQRLPDFYRRHGRQLLDSLADLTSKRHAKFGNTVYHLEPNVKDGPGGVRDIHFLHWVSMLAPGKEPLRHAVSQVEMAREFLYRVRSFLHERSGRDNNLLSFELQDEAARALPVAPQSPEAWMRDFYRHARVSFQATRQVLDFIERSESGLVRQFLERRDRLSTPDFTVSHNQLYLRNPASTFNSLRSAFETFVFVARHGIPLAWDTERRFEENLSSLYNAARVEPLAWDDWKTLLVQPHAALALRAMQDTRLLSLVLPAWQHVESLVVRDFYHRYTVDEHTIVSIETVDQLLQGTPATELRFCQLAREELDLALVRMALLLHDLGKGTKPGEHVLGSSNLAAEFLTTMKTPEADKRTILFLIAHHLDLSLVMNSRDLQDPATARYLSSQIGTYEDARKLTLLTYADVSAVNPGAMTPWRSEQLWRVYTLAAAQLTRELASDRIHQSADARLLTLARPEVARFLEGFPTRYLRIHSPEQIEEHFRLEQLRVRDGVALEISREPESYLMTVLSADHPGLFADLCGTLASFGMSIAKAEAASNANRCVLDEFRFADPTRTLELNPVEIERLRWSVECVVTGAVKVSDLLKRRRPTPRPNRASRLLPSVRFDNFASDSCTLVNFTGEDRPGLLFDLASILTKAGCDIEVVLVNTEAHRAIDVFYVTKGGAKLDKIMEEDLVRQLT
ncbi:MAG: HD domain-containing protein [Acidobacteriota bacterium]|nr:HD domain-containing protein [Acidobacteriota bacterium]